MGPSPSAASPDRLAPAASDLETRKLLADGSLESMMRQVEHERREGEALAGREAAGQERQAQAIKAAKAQSSAQFAQEVATPISSLLAAIAAHLQPAALLGAPQFLPIAVAELATLIERYERNVEPALLATAQQLDRQLEPVLDAVATLQQHARKADDIVKQMEHAARLQSVGERQAAALAMANSSPRIAPRASAHLQSTNSLVAASKRLVASLSGAKDELRRAETQRPDMASLRDRSVSSFDRAFAGKSPSEARAARDALIGEARRQYGSDPRLLAATEKVIVDEARARGAN
jgi:hypothetical protein